MTTTAPDFGRDLDTSTGDIDPFGREVTGIPALAQALAARLETETGTLVDDEDGDYGFDIFSLASEGLTQDAIAAIPDRIKAELEEDERVARVDVTVTQITAETMRLAVRVIASAGPTFDFVLAIDKVAGKVLATEVAA